MPLSGKHPAKLWAVIKDLTIAEVHALTYGVVHGVGIVAAYAIGLPGLSAGLVATAFVLLGYLKGDQARDIPFVTAIIDAIPKVIKGQLRREAHYYGGALVASGVLSTAGAVAAGLL